MTKIALVGRPNVGKSALFNRICKKRISIVDDTEGVTRDRIYAKADVFGQEILLIDTGGIDPHSNLPHNEEVKRQAEIAIEEADSIIMVVDARVGATSIDELVARLLLRSGKKVCLAVNKIDDHGQEHLMHQFYSLAIPNMIGVSAVQGYQIAELLEAATEGIIFNKDHQKIDGIKVAIIGRPNMGKSTLVNYLLEEERCVVSPIAGTTRDSIDVKVTVEGKSFTLIDTAGIRRKSAEHEVVDKFAAIRTDEAIEKADICVLMLDAQEGITGQEKRIANQIEASGKGCILLCNKWDLVKGFRMEHCLKGIQEEALFLKHCPTFFISAKTGRNLGQLFGTISEVYEQLQRRITTGQLNKFIEKAIQKYHPPMIQGRRLRIFYMAQVEVFPPRFVLFVNRPELMTETYKKYILHQFRDHYGFNGVPLTFVLRGRDEKQSRTPEQALEDKIAEEIAEIESSEEEFVEQLIE